MGGDTIMLNMKETYDQFLKCSLEKRPLFIINLLHENNKDGEAFIEHIKHMPPNIVLPNLASRDQDFFHRVICHNDWDEVLELQRKGLLNVHGVYGMKRMLAYRDREMEKLLNETKAEVNASCLQKMSELFKPLIEKYHSPISASELAKGFHREIICKRFGSTGYESDYDVTLMGSTTEKFPTVLQGKIRTRHNGADSDKAFKATPYVQTFIRQLPEGGLTESVSLHSLPHAVGFNIPPGIMSEIENKGSREYAEMQTIFSLVPMREKLGKENWDELLKNIRGPDRKLYEAAEKKYYDNIRAIATALHMPTSSFREEELERVLSQQSPETISGAKTIVRESTLHDISALKEGLLLACGELAILEERGIREPKQIEHLVNIARQSLFETGAKNSEYLMNEVEPCFSEGSLTHVVCRMQETTKKDELGLSPSHQHLIHYIPHSQTPSPSSSSGKETGRKGKPKVELDLEHYHQSGNEQIPNAYSLASALVKELAPSTPLINVDPYKILKMSKYLYRGANSLKHFWIKAGQPKNEVHEQSSLGKRLHVYKKDLFQLIPPGATSTEPLEPYEQQALQEIKGEIIGNLVNFFKHCQPPIILTSGSTIKDLQDCILSWNLQTQKMFDTFPFDKYHSLNGSEPLPLAPQEATASPYPKPTPIQMGPLPSPQAAVLIPVPPPAQKEHVYAHSISQQSTATSSPTPHISPSQQQQIPRPQASHLPPTPPPPPPPPPPPSVASPLIKRNPLFPPTMHTSPSQPQRIPRSHSSRLPPTPIPPPHSPSATPAKAPPTKTL